MYVRTWYVCSYLESQEILKRICKLSWRHVPLVVDGFSSFFQVSDDSYYKDCYGSVQERYWLSSRGVAIFVDAETPLFVQMNDVSDPNKLNLVAKYDPPYRKPPDMKLAMTYYIYQNSDVTMTHRMASHDSIPRPLAVPDERLFRFENKIIIFFNNLRIYLRFSRNWFRNSKKLWRNGYWYYMYLDGVTRI